MKVHFLLCFLLVQLSTSQPKSAFNVSNTQKKEQKYIIDTDAGAEDAAAILLALNIVKSKTDFKICAITCTYGRTEESNVEKNVLKILTIANMSHIPVYGGAKKPILANWSDPQSFGKDGFNDFEFTENITAEVDSSKHAALALIELVKENPGEITIITLGPLTNLALAATIDPTFMRNVFKIFSVGTSPYGFGNLRSNVDFNFGTDPESSFIFLNSTLNPIFLVTKESNFHQPIPMYWRKKVFGNLETSEIKFLNKVESINKRKTRFWSTEELKTVAIAFCPVLIKSSFEINATPVYDGAAKGSIIFDYYNLTGNKCNSRVILRIKLNQFLYLLLSTFSKIFLLN